jgi:hypothetical protein
MPGILIFSLFPKLHLAMPFFSKLSLGDQHVPKCNLGTRTRAKRGMQIFGERTRPRVLVLAPRQNNAGKSSRSRGRDRQHARRVRSPDFAVTAKGSGKRSACPTRRDASSSSTCLAPSENGGESASISYRSRRSGSAFCERECRTTVSFRSTNKWSCGNSFAFSWSKRSLKAAADLR